MAGKNQDYQDYRDDREKLAEIIEAASGITGRLSMPVEKELAELAGRVKNDTFKILVTGIKSGKSTLINALLGEEILPVMVVPCTAIITEVKYGEEKQAVLHFKDPLPNPLLKSLKPEILRHTEKHQGGSIPPMKIPCKEIEDYLAADNWADLISLQSFYEKVEIFCPAEFLKNGVEIIEFPWMRAGTTMAYLQKADIILFVMNAAVVCTTEEMDFVKQELLYNGPDFLFFVVNRWDCICQEDQPGLRRFLESRMRDMYQKEQMKKQPELLYVSAYEALDGQMNQDTELLEKSGIMVLEKRLAEFLTKEMGRARLISLARKVRRILDEEALGIFIPKGRALLKENSEELRRLQEKYNEMRSYLDLAVQEKQRKERYMTERIERSVRKFERLARGQQMEIISAIPTWIAEFEPVTDLGIVFTKNKVEQVISEILDHIKGRIRDEQKLWQKDVLEPEIEAADWIFSEAKGDFREIFIEISDDKSSPTVGGINNIGKTFSETLASDICVYNLMSILAFLNPAIFLMTAFMALTYCLVIGLGINRTSRINFLKKNITEQIVNNMKEAAPELAAKTADGIRQKFQEKADEILDSVSRELADIEGKLNTVMQEKEKEEREVEYRKESLRGIEEEIYALNAKLDNLLFKLMEEYYSQGLA